MEEISSAIQELVRAYRSEAPAPIVAAAERAIMRRETADAVTAGAQIALLIGSVQALAATVDDEAAAYLEGEAVDTLRKLLGFVLRGADADTLAELRALCLGEAPPRDAVSCSI